MEDTFHSAADALTLHELYKHKTINGLALTPTLTFSLEIPKSEQQIKLILVVEGWARMHPQQRLHCIDIGLMNPLVLSILKMAGERPLPHLS